jgi:hypothetical protein
MKHFFEEHISRVVARWFSNGGATQFTLGTPGEEHNFV